VLVNQRSPVEGNQIVRNRLAQVLLPERAILFGLIGVEGIDVVLHSGHINHVVNTLARDVDAGNYQRLGVDLTVDENRKQLPEAAFHRGGSQFRFVQIGAGTSWIVVLCEHVFGVSQRRKQENRSPSHDKVTLTE